MEASFFLHSFAFIHIVWFFYWVISGIEAETSCVQSMCSTTELRLLLYIRFTNGRWTEESYSENGHSRDYFYPVATKFPFNVLNGSKCFFPQAPHVIHLRGGVKMGEASLRDSLIVDGLTDAFYCYHMGVTGKPRGNSFFKKVRWKRVPTWFHQKKGRVGRKQTLQGWQENWYECVNITCWKQCILSRYLKIQSNKCNKYTITALWCIVIKVSTVFFNCFSWKCGQTMEGQSRRTRPAGCNVSK